MKILAIDTSTDETSVAVTEDTHIISNVIWSQAVLHSKWGGVVPALARLEHQKRINWVVQQALKRSKSQPNQIDAIAVTVGPGLAIALEVGIKKAKELSYAFRKPLIAVNHLEGHILSPLAKPEGRLKDKGDIKINFPAAALVVSGGNTLLAYIKNIGSYKILARTHDDALGEALDKAARMLGLGYPGGPILEKFARTGNADKYYLPVPLLGQERRAIYSYSGLKTAMWKLIEEIKKEKKEIKKEDIENLSASFQTSAFAHLIRVTSKIISDHKEIKDLLVGGGVSANNQLRKDLRRMGKKLEIKILFPYSKKLCLDNAAMIGIAAYFRAKRGKILDPDSIHLIDRLPDAQVEEKFKWE